MVEIKPAPGPRMLGLGGELFAEFVGTFLLILIGNGAIAVAVAVGSYGLGAVSVMWFGAVTLGVYAASAVSGAHINPAVTLGFAAFTDFPWRKAPAYIATQIVAAFVAAATIYFGFRQQISGLESMKGLTRGEPGSQLSAMIFATYAPNPAEIGTDPEALNSVTFVQWFALEAIMTAILVFAIMYIVDPLNEERPLANVGPVTIGLVVGALVAFGGAITMTAINPARDLGPRLFILLAGWGDIAFPGPRGGWWIPLAGPSVGGVVGGFLYQIGYRRVFPKAAPPGREGFEETSAESAAGA